MGFRDVVDKLIGIDEDNDEFTQEEIDEEKNKVKKEESKPVSTFTPKTQANTQRQASLSFNGTSALKMVVIEPKNFDESPKLVDSLKGRRPVIINLEKVETETARKIFDFLSGATYALNGTVQKVSANIFIFAPESVDISTNQDERGFSYKEPSNPWMK